MEKKRHYVSMRRFIILSSFIIGFVSFFISYKKKEDTSLLAKLEQMMYRTKMDVHCDPFYGYQIHYPAFFEQVPDSLIHETGYCQFYFGKMLKIAQTAFVITNFEGFTVRQGMEHFAMEQHATERRCGSDYFLLSGPLYINHRPVEGYRFYAKYVQRQKLWFVQSLSYPASCTRAVSRLIEQIDDWQVWEEKE